ncbi:ROOT HAIR DEFECTIVE 3-like protein [Drosera capensis]
MTIVAINSRIDSLICNISSSSCEDASELLSAQVPIRKFFCDEDLWRALHEANWRKKVDLVALSSFEEEEEQFKEQVADLRHRFFHSIAPGGLAGDRRGVVPGFSSAVHSCTQSLISVVYEGCADAVIQEARWDTSKVRENLLHDIEAHIASVRETKLPELTTRYEANLRDALLGPVDMLLDGMSFRVLTWINKLEKSFSLRLRTMQEFWLNQKARDKAGKVLVHMKDRFTALFSHDSNSMPRVWSGKEDIRAIKRVARAQRPKPILLDILQAMATPMTILLAKAECVYGDRASSMVNARARTGAELGPSHLVLRAHSFPLGVADGAIFADYGTDHGYVWYVSIILLFGPSTDH